MGKIKDKVDYMKDFDHFQKTLFFMGANVPLGVLCLPPRYENALLRAGCLRVYDMINLDLRKVKGLGRSGSDLVAHRLSEFLTVSF